MLPYASLLWNVWPEVRVTRAEEVRAGAPVALLLYGLSAAHDAEGRPLGERRAPSAAKTEVPMVLEACPYDDERRGLPMNVSALEQIRRHLKAVLDDVAAFRATAAEQAQPTWDVMFLSVVDQLSGPLRHALGGPGSPMPAQVAVGHKLAAGFYDVVRRLLVAQARGEHRAATVDSLLQYVHAHRALVGGSEACGGPPRLIAWAADVFLNGQPGAPAVAGDARVRTSRALTQQLQLGVAWEVYDGVAEAAVLRLLARPQVQARNDFIRREVAEGHASLPGPPADHWNTAVEGALPHFVRATVSAAIARASRLEPVAPAAAAELGRIAALQEGAFCASNSAVLAELAVLCACYLDVRRAFVDANAALEARVREALALDEASPTEPHAAVLPRARALRWLEAALGHTVVWGAPPRAAVTLRNHRRAVALPPAP